MRKGRLQKLPLKKLHWLSYNEGLALAEKENKYVLIYFYTDECSWCKKMVDQTYSNEETSLTLNVVII